MYYINNLTNAAQQRLVLTGIPGIQINMLLRFMPRIQRWEMDLEYLNFIVNGLAVVASPNLLRQWADVIPFGIACTDIFRLDPYTVNDFASQNAKLFLLDTDEITDVEREYFS